MPNELKNNPDFAILLEACTKLKDLQEKANLALSMGGKPNNPAEQKYNQAASELMRLNNQYKALLDWLQLPNRKAALQEFAEHWLCPFLNLFFQA